MNIVRYLAFSLKTIRGMTIVHVGAHFGEEAARYQRWGAKRVIWVEAEPDIFEVLKSRIEDARKLPLSFFQKFAGAAATEHVLINTLVGEKDGGTAEFHLFNNDGASNSMFKMKRGEDDKFASVLETGEVLTLPVNTLDTALKSAGIDPKTVDVLVLDVQGAELLCLKGAMETLASAKYLESEVSRDPVYEGGVLLAELEPWLAQRGFRRMTMLRRPHMDAIFVNAGRT
jgi:FkbM family methyltransferase